MNVGMLDLGPQARAYANLVGVATAGTGAGTSGLTCASLSPPVVRVSPGSSAGGLVHDEVSSKLAGTLAACGSPMPAAAGRRAADRGAGAPIAAWIDAGALND